MPNKIYPFTTPSNYIYDDTKIEVVDGKAKLKSQVSPNVYAHYHLNEATGATIIDSSVNGRNGTPVNSPVSVAGKLNNCLSFNGSNQYVNCGDIAHFERTQPFSIEMWIRYTSTATEGVMGNLLLSGTGRGWQFYTTSGKLGFQLRGGSTGNAISITISVIINDDNWHHVIFTYNGSSLASGIKCYVDGVSKFITIIKNSLSASIVSSQPLSLGQVNGLYTASSIDEAVIYGKELTQVEVTQRYNSGNGTETPLSAGYPSDKPTIKPTTSWEQNGLSQFTAFVETLGEGNIGYQLSDDNEVNWRYWNGSAWAVTSDQYNDVSTIHTNIGSFPVTNEKIMFRAFLISDGEQQVELDTLEFTALVGNPPVVYAGADKNCYDHQTIKIFTDATISDPDGDIEQASVYYDIEESGWINIPKGEYGTLQEAIRNFQYTFDNVATINCKLKVIDQQSKITEDDMNIAVQKYTVTFNIKDKDGNHLANFQFLSGDGADWSQQNSPFTYDYNWRSSDYTIILDKVGFQTQQVIVEVLVHTENVTINVLGAVSPAEVADAVWDELRSGHTITGSFGKAIQEELSDIKSETDKIIDIKSETDKIIDIKSETDKIQLIKIKTDNITNIETLIKRILGLSQENYKLYDIVYASAILQQAKIKIYPTGEDLINDMNTIATYQIDCTLNPNGTYKDYKVRKL